MKGEKALPPVSGHTAFAIDHYIYIFGGLNAVEGSIYNTIFIVDTVKMEWVKHSSEVAGFPPSPRNAHTACVTSNNKVYIFGGSSPR